MTVGALLLTPGSGAGRDHRTLVAVERAVAPLPCHRIDFPYRLAGKRVPDRPPVAIAHLRDQTRLVAETEGIDPAAIVLGGRSYGGRMCSMAVAEGLPARGLVLLSYPLHPPGQPEKLRVAHFPDITVPVLVVSGLKDPFGSPEEFGEHLPAISGPVTQVWVDGAHTPDRSEPQVAAAVAEWIATL